MKCLNLSLTKEQFKALHEALSQFVENEREYKYYSDESVHLESAEELLVWFDSQYSKLAE